MAGKKGLLTEIAGHISRYGFHSHLDYSEEVSYETCVNLAKQVLAKGWEVVEGAELTGKEIKEKLEEIQPEGFDWVNITEAEMYKFKEIARAMKQAIQKALGKED